MRKSILTILIFSTLFMAGCFSMSHSFSNVNGEIQQKTCVNGDCHILIGSGTIKYDHRSGIITVICDQTGSPFVYDTDSFSGYNCTTDTALLKAL